MNEGKSKDIAAKIAKLLESESSSADFTALRHSIEKLNDRLDRIEAKMDAPAPVTASPVVSSHPSQDRFAVVEAIVDEVFSQYQQEKACTFEPNGKPCDHCSMCSSRGF
jgi:hypothetical protein